MDFLHTITGNDAGAFVVALLALIVLVFAIAVSIILVYHWRRYSFHARAVPFALTLYFAIAIPTVVVMIISAITYMQSL